MAKTPDMKDYARVFQCFWSIWKYYGAKHSDDEAWIKVISLSDEIISLVPEDETMHRIARMLLLRLEQRADELRKEEQQTHGKGNNGS